MRFSFFKSWRHSRGRTETMGRWEGGVDLTAGYSTPCSLHEKGWSGVLWWGGAEQSCEDHQCGHSHSHNVHMGTHSAELYGKLRVSSRWDENANNVSAILLSTTNKMQRYTIFFIIVNALHVSGVFSPCHQELKNCIHSIWYVPGLLAATTSVVELELNHTSGSSKQAWHIPDAVCTVLELQMTGGETARNM